MVTVHSNRYFQLQVESSYGNNAAALPSPKPGKETGTEHGPTEHRPDAAVRPS